MWGEMECVMWGSGLGYVRVSGVGQCGIKWTGVMWG